MLLESRMESLNSLLAVRLIVHTSLCNEVLTGRKKISLCFIQTFWLKLLSHLHPIDPF